MEFEVSFRETLRQLADAQVRLNSMGKVLDASTDKSGKMASAMASAAAKIRTEMGQLERQIERTNLLREDEKKHILNTQRAAEKAFTAMAKGNMDATLKLQAFNGELRNLDRLVKDTASKQAYTRWLQRSAALNADAAGKVKFYEDKLKSLTTSEGRAAVEAERLARERTKNIQQMGKEAAMADSHVRAYQRMVEAQKAAAASASNYASIVSQLTNAEREMAVTGQRVAWGYDVLTTSLASFRAQQQAAKEAVDANNRSMVEGVRNLERYTGANAQAEQAARSLAQQERSAASARTSELSALRNAMQTRAAQETAYQETVRQSAAAARTLTEAEARTRAGRDAQLAGTRAYNDAMVRNAEAAQIASGSLATYAAQLSRVTGSVSSGGAEKLNQQFAQMASRGREATSSLSALTKAQAQLQVAEERLIANLQRRNDLTLSQARATSTLSSSEARLTQRIKEQTAEYQRRAQYMQMTNAQLLGLSRSHDRISRDMNINAQAAAMFRAGLGGLNASIGIYTSATVLAASATYAMASAFRAGMSAGMEFTETMARAEAVMMTSSTAVTSAGRSMEAVTQQVRALGASTLYTSTEVAGGLVDLGMAGLSASDAMTSLAPALNLAAIGSIEMSRSADIATNVMTQFDKSASDLGNVVDIMATAVTNSNTNIEQLANALSYVGPAAQAAGFGLEDTTAAVELLTNAGIKGSRAGTGLRRFMLNIQNPTAKGAAVMREYGISILDAEGHTRSMTDILGQFNRALHNDAITPAERTAAIMDLVGVRAQSAVARMISSFDDFGVLRRQLEDVSGAAEKMRETIEEALSMDWRQLKSAFQDIQLDTFLKYEDTLRSFTAQARLSLMELQSVNEEMTNSVFSPEQIADGETVTELDILITKFGEAADVVTALGAGFLAFKGAGVAATMMGALSAQATSASHSMAVLNARGNLLNTTNFSLVASFRSLGSSLAAHWANVRYAASGTEMLTASLYSLATGATYAARALSVVASALGWAGLVYGVYTAVTTLFSNDTEERIRDHSDRVAAAKTRYQELQEAIERTTEARQLAALNTRASEAEEEAEGLRRRIQLTEITLANLDKESDVYLRVSDSLATYKKALDEAEKSASDAKEAAGQIGVNEAQVQGMRERVGVLVEFFGQAGIEAEKARVQVERLGDAGGPFSAMSRELTERIGKQNAVQALLSVSLHSSSRATEEATQAMVDHAAAIDAVLAAQSEQLREGYRFDSLSDFEKMNELEAEKARLLGEVAQAQLEAADSGGIAADIAERMSAQLVEVNEDLEEYRNSVQETWQTVAEKQSELEALQRNEIDTLESLEAQMRSVQAARIAMYAMSAVSGEVGDSERMLELTEKMIDLQTRLNTLNGKESKSGGKSASRELEQMVRAFQNLRQEFDPVAAATEEYNKQLTDMDKLLSLGKISTEDHAAAKAHLTKQYQESINPLTELRDILDPIGKLTEEYQERVEALDAAVAAGTITWLEAAEAKKILTRRYEESSDPLKDIRAQLSPVAVATEQYQHRVEDLARAVAEGTVNQLDAAKALMVYNEAHAQAVKGDGETFNEMAKRLAETYDSQHMKLVALAEDEQRLLEMRQKSNDPEMLERYNQQLENVRDEMDDLRLSADDFGERMGNALKVIGDSLQSESLSFEDKMTRGAKGTAVLADGLREMGDEGSAAFHALTIATDLQNISAAVGAIVNQGMGDPYTAFGRMAAMAAAVASLGINVGGIGGGGGMSSAEASQSARENQTYGSVLGDAKTASKSIEAAVDITANATSELVGINRSMLGALQNVQAGISGAVTLVARDMTTPDMGGQGIHANFNDQIGSWMNELPLGNVLNKVLDPLGGLLDGLGLDFLGGALGGKVKHQDDGLIINGGAIQDVINDTVVSAFTEWKEKKNFLSSYKTKRNTELVDEGVARQFGLVFESLYDSVASGVESLGMLPTDVQSKLDAFVLETTEISLDGLDPSEQKQHINDVFSRTFDGLADQVAPFLADMQQAGEGIGETLARVSTQVQVGQAAIDRLGFDFSLDTSSGSTQEIAARAAAFEYLSESAGGLEAFSTGMNDALKNFSSEAHQFQVLTSDISAALAQQNITLPTTRDGYWDLIQAQDGATTSGADNIATLLRLQETANSYYTQLEGLEESYRDKFYSEAERTALAVQDMAASFSDLGIKVPTTDAEFRHLIDTQDQASEAGRNFRAQLLGLASDFISAEAALGVTYEESLGRGPATDEIEYWISQIDSGSMTLTDALWSIANSAEAAEYAAGGAADTVRDLSTALRQREQLERQLLQLEGDTGAIRALEIAQLQEIEGWREEGLVSLQRHVWAMQDQATAAQEAERAAQSLAQAEAQVANERMGLERQLLQAMEDTNALRQMDLAQLDPSNRALQQRIWAIQDEKQASSDAESEISRVRQALNSASSASQGTSDALSELRSELSAAQNAAQSAWDRYRNQSLEIEIGLLELLGDESAILTLQRERELEGIDESLRPMQERLWALQDETNALQGASEAIGNYVEGLGQASDFLDGAFGNIGQWLDTLNATSQAPALNLEAASEQFERQMALAKTGDRDALQSVTRYADQYLTAAQEYYASSGDYTQIKEGIKEAFEGLPDAVSAEQFIAEEVKQALREQTQGISTQLGDVLRGDNPSNIAGNLAGYFNTLAGGIDNVLTREQLAIVMDGKATDAELAAIMRAVDINGDGVMTGLESVIIAGMPTDAVLGTLLRNKMSELDKNQLTHDQVRNALSPIASDAEIKALIKRVDVNGDGIISKQELTAGRIGGLTSGIINGLNPAFDMLDSNLDSKLTFAELSAGLEGMATDAQIQAMMRSMDLTGDGVISGLESVIIAGMPTDAVLGTLLNNKMSELDKNQLTHDQVRKALSPIASDAEIDRLIQRLDVNGEGIITQQELTAGRIGGLANGIGSTLKPMFDDIDLDTSGFIDYDEFAKAFAGMASDAELKRIFDKLDKDGAGQLSRLEAIEAYTSKTDDNTLPIEDRARDQLEELGGLNSSMTGLADGMVNLSGNISGLVNAIAQLADIQAEEIRAAQMEGTLSASIDSRVSGIRSNVSQATDRWEEMPASERSEHGSLNSYLQDEVPSGWGGIMYAGHKGVDQWNKQFSGIDIDEEWLKANPDFEYAGEQWSSGAAYVYVPEHRAAIAEWERLTGGKYTRKRYANGGMFDSGFELGRPATNSIVSSSTMFNMAEMGEVGPEAIIPLSRGAGGRLGVDTTGLAKLPDNLNPASYTPPLPQFPALGHNDVLQVLGDVKRELQDSRKEAQAANTENSRLLEVISELMEAHKEISEKLGEDQIEELESINRASKTRSTTV